MGPHLYLENGWSYKLQLWHVYWSRDAITKKMQNKVKGVGKRSRDLILQFWDPLYISGTVTVTNCNWGTCIAPPTRRPRALYRVNPYPGARKQNETEMFSDHEETSPSIAAVSAPSVARSMLGSVVNSSTCPRHEVATRWMVEARNFKFGTNIDHPKPLTKNA